LLLQHKAMSIERSHGTGVPLKKLQESKADAANHVGLKQDANGLNR